MGGVTILRSFTFYWLPAIMLALLSLVSQSSMAQSEEDILNSIGSELDDESAKKKAAAKIEKEYNSLKTKASASFKAKRFDKAKEYYNQMLTLKPDSDYASSKLTQIDQLIAAEKEKAAEKQYQAIITKADALLAAEQWAEASSKYKEATASRPNEAYPKSQLAKVSKLQADAKKAAEAAVLQKKYDDVLATAEKALSAKSWDVAKQQFQKAAALKPSESYPKEKAVEIDKLRAEAIAKAKKIKLDKEYTAQVAKADQLYTSHKWSEAIAAYKLAQGLKMAEAYPKEQISKAETRIKDELAKKKKEEELETEFQKQKKIGEDALASKNWIIAIESFRTASSLKPTNTDITGLLNQAKSGKKAAEDLALKEKANAEAELKIQKQFDSEMAKGKQAMTSKSWDLARASFTKAKTLKPAESSPDTKLSELDVLIADEKAAKAAAEEKKLAEEAALKAKIAEEKRLAEEQAAAEKAKQLAAEKLAAEEAAAEEARKVEEARIAAIAEQKRLDVLAAEKAKAEEEARLASEAKAAEEARLAEEQRLAEEKAAAEAAQKKKEAEIAAIAAAEEEARLAALAKATAEAKNKEELRIANEKAAAEEARLVEEAKLAAEAAALAETKRLAELAEQKAIAEEEARQAALAKAEADAKNKEEQRLADENAKAEEAKKQEAAKIAAKAAAVAETKRLAELASAKAKADEEARLLAEAKAEEDAKNKEEQRIAAEKEKNRLAEEQARKKQEFDQAVVEYKEAIKNSEWDLALRAINSAETFFPDNQEVLKMHSELSALQKAEKNALAAEKEKEENAKAKEKEYQNFIKKGDNAVASKEFDAATSSFNSALKLKPNEDYPKSQLASIKEMVLALNAAELEKQKAIDKEYSEYLTKGEGFISEKNYSEAKASFNKAKELKPENQGPTERIAEIDRLIQKEKDLANQAAALEEDYKERLKNGQISLDNKKFADAKRFFYGAGKLKPNEALPKEKLKETEALWAVFVEEEKAAAAKQKADALEANYNGFIMAGDQAISNKMWDEAIKSFQGAMALKQDEAYPKEKLSYAKQEKALANAEAEKVRAEEEARLLALEAERVKAEAQAKMQTEMENSFSEAIKRGDAAMNIESYKSAVAQYRKAVKLKPEDSGALSKLDEASIKYKESEAIRLAEENERKRLAAIELEKRQEAARIQREAYLAEIRKNSPEELAKKYPDGITEEVDTDNEMVLTKSIIVEKGEGRYLIRFDYPWGEHFYYLNGRKIRADTYNWNIRKYKF
jgi:hypothetical protein